MQCGKGLQDGVRLEVDHIKPKDKGGKATIENGQVLCAPHKLQEKELWSNRNSKKMFIRLYEAAKNIGDDEIISFSAQVLDVFEKKMM
mgnify:CR=1 FL=1